MMLCLTSIKDDPSENVRRIMEFSQHDLHFTSDLDYGSNVRAIAAGLAVYAAQECGIPVDDPAVEQAIQKLAELGEDHLADMQRTQWTDQDWLQSKNDERRGADLL